MYFKHTDPLQGREHRNGGLPWSESFSTAAAAVAAALRPCPRTRRCPMDAFETTGLESDAPQPDGPPVSLPP